MSERDKPFEVTPRFLDRVRFENIRNNQVGGMTDGITPQRAQDDLGIESDEQYERIRQEVADRQPQPPQNPELGQESQEEEQRVEQAAKKIGTVLCADCYRVVPCQHVGVRADGSRYTRGY